MSLPRYFDDGFKLDGIYQIAPHHAVVNERAFAQVARRARVRREEELGIQLAEPGGLVPLRWHVDPVGEHHARVCNLLQEAGQADEGALIGPAKPVSWLQISRNDYEFPRLRMPCGGTETNKRIFATSLYLSEPPSFKGCSSKSFLT